jgi:hypothetical protein
MEMQYVQNFEINKLPVKSFNISMMRCVSKEWRVARRCLGLC